MNGAAGAFFTPHGLAQDFSLEVPRGKGRRIVDLCAGIGALSFHCEDRVFSRADESHFVCVERNPDYVEAGRAVMPDATWVCASVFDLAAYQHLGPCVSPLGRSPLPTSPILIAPLVGATAFAKNAENSLPARENIGVLPARKKALAFRRASRLPCGAWQPRSRRSTSRQEAPTTETRTLIAGTKRATLASTRDRIRS